MMKNEKNKLILMCLTFIVIAILITPGKSWAPRVIVVDYGVILGFVGPSVQGRICNSCTGEGINMVSVELKKAGEVSGQTEGTNPDGIYPPLSAHGGPYTLSFTATGYIDKEIPIDLPPNSSIVDHATYLLPDTGYEGCISGTVTKTIYIVEGVPNTRGVQNMEVKLYQGSTEITPPAITDVGGNYHFTGLSSGTYKIEPVITTSECYTTPSEYTGIDVPTDQQYNFDLNCPTNPQSTGAYWSDMGSGTSSLLHAIWGSSTTNIFAVGDGGEIVHYNGSNWTGMTSNTTSDLKGVWGSSETVVYAVGEGGTVIRTTDGGINWSLMTSNTTKGLNAIWGSSSSDIFAVGDSGTIIHYNGTGWSLPMVSNTTENLLSVWGNSASDVYAMGNSHKDGYWKRTVLRYNGSVWSVEEAGNGVTLMSSWGSAADDITATGSFGSIMHYDGIDWKQTGGPTERTLNAMWGASWDDIFAVGCGGVIAHYDGTDWNVRETDVPNDLYGIWGNSATEVFAVGDNGKIFKYNADADGDGEPNNTDNCPEIANPGQEDTYPPQGNSIGDACDCEGDFDCSGGVDATDVDAFLADFGRSTFINPCSNADPCNGDFNCDVNVDAADVTTFLDDFGRSQFNNPCPACVVGNWCVY